MKFGIAGITVEVTGEGLEYAYGQMLPYSLGPSAGPADLRISCEFAARIAPLRLEPVYGVRHFGEEFGLEAGQYIAQDREGEEVYSAVRFSEDFHRACCSLVDVERLGGPGIGLRVNAAVRDCVVNCLPAFDGLTFHASAVSYRGSALLFAAPSGTGKSTQTRIWRECYGDEVVYINDDTPVIRREQGVFCAFGTPWAGKSGVQNNVSAPIRAIVYVVRDSENRIRPMDGEERALRGLRSARTQRFPVQRERQTKLLFSLMREVPVYELRCTMTPSAARLLHRTLFA